MLHVGRARHPGPGKRSFIPGQLSIEFANIGGWLTYGDLALDSCAQFLAVAEHRLIPSRAWAVSHQLRRTGHQSVWSPACQDQVAGGRAGVGVVSPGGAPPISVFCSCVRNSAGFSALPVALLERWVSFLVGPCSVGRHMSRLQCSQRLTSRPLQSCHHQCLKAVCGFLGYPVGAAAELLDGTLKLRCCSSSFSKRFPLVTSKAWWLGG